MPSVPQGGVHDPARTPRRLADGREEDGYVAGSGYGHGWLMKDDTPPAGAVGVSVCSERG